MTKEFKIDKKLKAYSALVAGVLALGSNAGSQIVYTDVIPDSTFTIDSSFYDLDLNNDNIRDFQIMLILNPAGNPEYLTGLHCETHAQVLGSFYSGWMYPFALNANDTVSSGQSLWGQQSVNQYALCTMAWSFPNNTSYGNWFGATDKYLGLRIEVSGHKHYGWARLDVDSTGSSFTIKDYGHNASPDSVIYLNMVITETQDNELTDVSMHAWNSILFVKMGSTYEGTIQVTNIVGQVVKEFKLTDCNMEINLNDIDDGIYIVSLITESGAFTRKVLLN